MAHNQERNRGVIRVILEQDTGFTAWLSDQFGTIRKRFDKLESTMGKLEDYVKDIKDAQAETATHVDAIKADVTALLTTIANFPTGGLTAEQEAALKDAADGAKAIAASVKAVDEMAPVPAPVPTPEPTPAPSTPTAGL
jgi:methyl-accepting chemotaxis protein